ncbi:Helicase associated domain protein [Mycobacterium sp. Y57]|uniref:DEAD/DEAH box helicase n=1 Tax=Mycolicibacterium xanthum TaxID=2796469 RepID=UPI001C858A58|nr:DEAD/DEAH box helicase [Mycolicibacterium xanthum]MBX7433783.1 Helicase associated domain protein [Mycolicibacterium xanthum]
MGDFDGLYGNLDADSRVRGRQFEHVCKWFLENDPVYRSELRRVWLWDEWPGRWGGDAGIDLVAEDWNRGLWAIQAKAYDPKYRVSKKDVDKFLAESGRKVFAYRMLIATTDLIDRIGERTIQQQEKRSSFFRLNDLRAASVDWPTSPAFLRRAKRRKPAQPRPHQAEAVRDVLKGFMTSDRGQLIMACGTGKTLNGLFITENLKAHRTLVLLPSLSLLKQTLNEWRANCTNDFASLPVCSDDTVAGTDDAALAHTADLGVPVTTDPKEIAVFLRRNSGPLVVFSTYQSSPQIEAAFKLSRVPGFDLVIADEAHRVAGPVSSDFATVLNPAAIKGTRRLFMTATPRYFTGRVLKAAQDADYEVASMDDEEEFGPVFHRLPFGEAIERDLLTDYQVAVVGVDGGTYRAWAEKGSLVTRDGKTIDNAATLAGQIGLAKAMRRYNLRRVISFHSRVKRAREFAASMPDVIAWIPAPQRPRGTLWSDVATGEMPAGDRYVLLQHLGRLDDADRGLLANVRCLSEGVDVPTLDGVAFIDPRRSEVDIVQAVGRAIRRSEGKTVGTIVIPVFIDTDEEPDVALDSSVFKPVWDVIKALRAHDEELGEQLDELRRQIGRIGGNPLLPDKIHVDVPVAVGTDFADAFNVRLVEQTTASWDFMFGVLERYVSEHGHSRVPRGCEVDRVKLAGWVTRQRVAYAENTLREDRRLQLEALPGWTWDPFADQWEAGFNALMQYIDQHGPQSVPQRCEVDGFSLGTWASQQRAKRANGTIDPDRERRLGAVPGWSWNPKDDQWHEGLRRLREHLKSGPDVPIPAKKTIANGFQLGTWVDVQRRDHKRGTLRPDRRELLEALPGWTWNPQQDKWEEWFAELQVYVTEHGDSRVPDSYATESGSPLGNWVGVQRALHAKGKLGADRADRLASLSGWNWEPVSAQWEEGFASLEAYVAANGNARVSFDYTAADGYPLGRWVARQRSSFRDSRLASERVARLERLDGWSWRANEDRWEEGLKHLVAYIARNGDARVLGDCVVDGFALGRWVLKQRTRHGKGELEIDRAARLADLPGWSWDPHAEKWEEGFRILQEYTARYGDARVPAAFVTEDGYPLGTWTVRQRRLHVKGTLSLDRQQRLDSIPSWTWKAPRGPAPKR